MRPIELYKFSHEYTDYRYTSYDTDVVYLSEVYTSIAIGRSNIELKNELSKATLEVNIDLHQGAPKVWLSGYQEKVISLTVFQQTASGTNVIWKGRVVSINPQPAFFKITLESIFTSLRRPGLRARFQRNCRHVLYSPECGANMDYSKITVLVTAMDSRRTTLTLTNIITYPEGPFSDQEPNKFFTGMLLYNGIYRTVIGQSTTGVTLTKPITDLFNALQNSSVYVTIYFGCDKSREVCQNRFSRIQSNGSFPYIPSKNPFNGSSIV